MSVDVLRSKSQITDAHEVLRKRGLSCTDSKLQHIARKLKLNRTLKVGDERKSWDVLKTTQFIEKTIPKDSAILDIGAYACEVLCILHRLGYSNLTGVDLNPQIHRMPYADTICYIVSDFLHAPFESGSFEIITAISVIEHGLDSTALLSETSRLLRPGGFLVASFDYWPEKIDTTGVSFFGMDWNIFSQQEVLTFIEEAREYKFTPCGKIDLDARDRTIDCAGRQYTFAWLALRKEPVPSR